jgi:hypothetical protein
MQHLSAGDEGTNNGFELSSSLPTPAIHQL